MSLRARKLGNSLYKAISEAIPLWVDWTKIQVIKNKRLHIYADSQNAFQLVHDFTMLCK